MAGESDFNVDSFFNLDAMHEESDFNVDSLLNLDAMDEESDFNVDGFLNLDAMEEEFSVEALLEAADAAAQPRQDPATLVETHTVPNAQVFPDLQAAASDHVLLPSQVPAPSPVQHQQTLGEASAYGFDEQMMTQAPIAHVQHPDARAVHVQEHLEHHQAPLQEMMMPAPVANVQTNIQAVPSDQVPETAEPLQHMLGEPTLDFHGFEHEIPVLASGDDQEEFSGPPSPDSLEMHDDLAEAFISDEVNQEDSSSANDVPDDIVPMEDEDEFVPLVPGRLQCNNCRVVRQIRIRSETRDDLVRIHSATNNGTFQHAILDRKIKYIAAERQAARTERLYVDFSRRTGEWVRDLFAVVVRSLRNEGMATVEDSDEAVNTPPIVNDAYQIMEIAMLKIIDSNPENVEMPVPSPPRAAQPAAVPPPPPPAARRAPAMEAAANTNLSHEIIGLNIFESRPFVREDQFSEIARVHSARQQERMASSSEEEKVEEEIRQYLHEIKEKAQRELDIHKPSLAVKRFCRKMQWTWMLDRIKRINKNIVNKKAINFRLSRLLQIRDMFNEFVAEKERLSAEIISGMKKERESNGSYRVSKNDDEAGPSGTKKGSAL